MPLIDLFHLILQYLAAPLGVWLWSLHRIQNLLQTEIEVLKAQVIARETARNEEKESTRKQLDQILSMLQNLNGRIDAVMRFER